MTFHQGLDLTGIIIVVLLVWGITKIPGLLKDVLRQVFKDAILVYVWRHFTGAHYHGRRVTDAGWWTHANNTKRHDFERGTFMDHWEHKPRGHRALWRWAVTFALFGALYGAVFDRAVTLHAVYAMGVYLVVALVFVIEMKIRLRVHRRHVETPIVKSLAAYLRLSPHAVRRMLHIKPENITDEGEIGYLEMPPELTPGLDQQTGIERIIDAHLPVGSEVEFKMEQAPKIAVIQAARKPPGSVLWTAQEVQQAMAKCMAGEVFLGFDRDKQPYRASLTDLEDPHWGFDVNTKYGKSNFLGIVAVQILHQSPNAQAFIVDPKRSSLIDFVGSPDLPDRPLLPGVRMANDPGDPLAMWKVVKDARALLDSRSEEAAKDRGKKFDCALVILDELNQFGDIMKDMWNDFKAQDKRRPKEDREGLDGMWPGWADIMAILRMGRFVNMHILACAQDFRDDAFGGRGGRNYLGFKGMAGFSPSQWDKFIGKKPTPVMQNHPGRWIVSDGHDETWIQVMFANAEHDRSAYDYAAYGRTLHVPTVLEGSVLEEPYPSLPTLFLPALTDGQADDGDVIVGYAAADDYLGYKEGGFYKARWREFRHGRTIPGEFKKGRQRAWRKADLDDWMRNRPRAKGDPSVDMDSPG